jgi:hypothetical protein
VTPQSGSLLPG